MLRNKIDREKRDVVGSKSRKALKTAQVRIKKLIKKNYSDGDQEYYDELTNIIWSYISDKLKIPVADLSRERTDYALDQIGVKADTIRDLMSFLDYCELSSYARGAQSRSVSEMNSQIEQIINSLDNEIKS